MIVGIKIDHTRRTRWGVTEEFASPLTHGACLYPTKNPTNIGILTTLGLAYEKEETHNIVISAKCQLECL